MNRFSLRIRLTAAVTLLFGLGLAAAAVVGLNQVEQTLTDDTRDIAQELLDDFLEQLGTGPIAEAELSADAASRVVILGPDGDEITRALGGFRGGVTPTAIDRFELGDPIDLDDCDLSNPMNTPWCWPALLPPDLLTSGPSIEDPSGRLALDLADRSEAFDPESDVVIVGAPIFTAGTELTVAVSSPLRPVKASVDALRNLFLALVPTMTAAAAVATWLIVGRALKPVDAMADRVDQIGTDNLEERVPEPNGRDELRHLAQTMNAMLERLQTSRDVQRRFVSDASHELRSPISATLATLEVALETPDSTDWQEAAGVAFDENVRLAGLVDDLLLSAQLEEGATQPRRQPVDLEEICLEEAERARQVDVTLKIRHPARVQGDPLQLERAIRNLVDNAATHATNLVGIVVDVIDDRAVVEVVDDGPGVPAAEQDRIFDRFHRLDQSRARNTKRGGAGLGLAITQQVAAAHGGTVTVADADPTGARFVFTIPLDSTGLTPLD